MRKYPSYTTAQLESAIAEIKANETGSDACMRVIAMGDEVARRKAGISQAAITPQLAGGKIMTKIGRM
jgi:hypothetical protein